MNITEYIVAHLKEGHNVELPGIGTFAVRHIDVHYDSTSGTLFPARQTLIFEPRSNGDNSIVKYIAEQECVGETTAQQMFKNYLDALKEKLDTQHRHTFSGMGTITKEGALCSFEADPNLSLNADDRLHVPLAHVKKYNTSVCDDPFAQFSQPFHKKEAGTATQEKAAHAPGTQKNGQPTAGESQPRATIIEPVTVATAAQRNPHPTDSPKDGTALKEKLTTHTADVEKRPAGQPMPDEGPVPAEQPQPAGHLSGDAVEVQPSAEAAEARTATAGHQAEAVFSHAAQTSAPAALASLQEMEKLPRQKADGKIQGDDIGKQSAAGDSAKLPKNKKQGGLIVILCLLVALVLGGAAYYYFKRYRPAHQISTTNLNIEEMVTGSEGMGVPVLPAAVNEDAAEGAGMATMEETGREGSTAKNAAEAAATSDSMSQPAGGSTSIALNNDFTLAADAIVYDSEDIRSLSGDIYRYLQSYINSYLQRRHYSKASEAMRQKVLSYATQRLTEMLPTEGYHVQDFFNYCNHDYQHVYFEKDLKERHAARQRVAVQRELMDTATLERLLNEVLQGGEMAADPHQAAQPRRQKEAYAASARETTKKGFDIIAGFFVNRAGADKMAANLKRKGCDAYIISRDGLYYVSMGSAASQTEAEHLYRHIKEWYKGDVAIKKW